MTINYDPFEYDEDHTATKSKVIYIEFVDSEDKVDLNSPYETCLDNGQVIVFSIKYNKIKAIIFDSCEDGGIRVVPTQEHKDYFAELTDNIEYYFGEEVSVNAQIEFV